MIRSARDDISTSANEPDTALLLDPQCFMNTILREMATSCEIHSACNLLTISKLNHGNTYGYPSIGKSKTLLK